MGLGRRDLARPSLSALLNRDMPLGIHARKGVAVVCRVRATANILEVGAHGRLVDVGIHQHCKSLAGRYEMGPLAGR